MKLHQTLKYLVHKRFPGNVRAVKLKCCCRISPTLSPSHCLHTQAVFVRQAVTSCCVGLINSQAIFQCTVCYCMRHNPVLNPIVWINQLCYCPAWVYNPHHCSPCAFFITVCKVGAETCILSQLSDGCRNESL